MVEMITGIDLSQEIFAGNVLRTLKSSLKHRRKHVLRSLQLYGDQALVSSFIIITCKFNTVTLNKRTKDLLEFFETKMEK